MVKFKKGLKTVISFAVICIAAICTAFALGAVLGVFVHGYKFSLGYF